jgi:hypothetical protein
MEDQLRATEDKTPSFSSAAECISIQLGKSNISEPLIAVRSIIRDGPSDYQRLLPCTHISFGWPVEATTQPSPYFRHVHMSLNYFSG